MSKIGSIDWTNLVTKKTIDNRANQLNPNNSAYYSSRGISTDTSGNGIDSFSTKGSISSFIESKADIAIPVAVTAAIAAVAAGAIVVAGGYLAYKFISKKKDWRVKRTIESKDFNIMEDE